MKIYAGCKRLFSALEDVVGSAAAVTLDVKKRKPSTASLGALEGAALGEGKADHSTASLEASKVSQKPRSLHEDDSNADRSCMISRPALVNVRSPDTSSRASPLGSPSYRAPTPNDSMPGQSHSWLRSGRGSVRVFSHPQVSPQASIVSLPLSDFQLSETSTFADTAASSQVTESENWDTFSPARSYSSTGTLPPGVPSPGARTPPPEAVVGQSPRRPCRVIEIAPHRYRYNGSRRVDEWFGECFESDGYDSKDIDDISTPPRQSAQGSSQDSASAVSVASSPGFVLLGDTSLQSARSEWRREFWPVEVMVLIAQYNPDGIKFPRVSSGRRN
ncbi:hypothetical protein PPTG_05077 [Phytophthora nicotianae INRA-310]|uniref:Uncharacterized protein n=5 Tax=Phytophthora nicotianae TaxID=4792 RepID=W2QXP8_PHYN3|nr:hypothetical protein PPTG_05077 [Phytophthora nicotianae INRA-310]ETI34550.1 hypothetical protein F443_18955 [Phytophthora nicotianae P1569]ETN17224.1 hypothetical protein PPTG_05077 [Phytophthora nicotianae INRA-310]